MKKLTAGVILASVVAVSGCTTATTSSGFTGKPRDDLKAIHSDYEQACSKSHESVDYIISSMTTVCINKQVCEVSAVTLACVDNDPMVKEESGYIKNEQPGLGSGIDM